MIVVRLQFYCQDHANGLLIISTAVIFLPHFLLAVISTVDFSSRQSVKTITSHPSLLLLPTFTFFTFSRLWDGHFRDRRLSFSVFMTKGRVHLVLFFDHYHPDSLYRSLCPLIVHPFLFLSFDGLQEPLHMPKTTLCVSSRGEWNGPS